MGDLYNHYIGSVYNEYLYDDPLYTEDIRSREVMRLFRLLYTLISGNHDISRHDAYNLGLYWLIYGKIYEQIFTGDSVDPVLPSDKYSINQAIVDEFDIRGISCHILSEMQTELKRSFWRVQNEYSDYKLWITRINPNRYRLSYGPSIHYINSAAHDWVSSLYNGDNFENDLYKMVARYRSTRLYDTASSVSQNLLRFLEDKGMNHDLMASPESTILNSYTGVYPDIDFKFGSLGKFTDIRNLLNEEYFPDGLFMWLNGPDIPYSEMAIRYISELIQEDETVPLTLIAISQNIPDIPEEILTFSSITRDNKNFLILQNDIGADKWYFSESDINRISTYI